MKFKVFIPYIKMFFLGALFVYAFAPFNNYFLAFFLLPVLLFSYEKQDGRSLFLMSWAMFSGFFTAIVYWLYFSLHVYAHAGLFPVLLAILGFSCYLALFPALSVSLAQRSASLNSKLGLFVALPAYFVIFEWLRGWLFTGFPWAALGYSQTESIFGQTASLFGVYGLSALTLIIGSTIYLLFKNYVKQFWILFVVIFCLGLFSWWYLTMALCFGVVASFLWKRQNLVLVIPGLMVFALLASFIPWTKPIKESKLKLALLQGSINQAEKWLKPKKSINRYMDLTSQVFIGNPGKKNNKPDVVIWPETAIPKYYSEVKKTVIKQLQSLAIASKTDFILGITVDGSNLPKGTADRAYNSAIKIGSELQFYSKIHLVPYGEYSPFRESLADFYKLFSIDMSNFKKGEPDQALLTVKNHPIGVFICYEIGFTDEVNRVLPRARFLLNLSNNAWFYDPKKHNPKQSLNQFNAWINDSTEAYQQVQMAQMRAIESGRDVVSVTNDGLTAFINHKGKLTKKLKRYTVGILRGEVELRQGSTLFILLGNYFILFLAVLGLIVVTAITKRQSKPHRA